MSSTHLVGSSNLSYETKDLIDWRNIMKNILVCKTDGYDLGKQDGIGLGSEGYGLGKTLESWDW